MHNVTRDQATLTVADFDPAAYVKAAPGASHFRLIHVIGVVSDFKMNTTTMKYEPNEPVNDKANASVLSNYIAIDANAPVNITLTVNLAGPPTLTAEESVIQALGIIFYQLIGNVYYPLSQGNAAKVVAVF